jgi:folate-dependent phosphoribosylglycinamide formyltransferase PurN
LQKKVLIEHKNNEKELKAKVQKQEYKAYSQAIYKIYS